MVVNSFHQKFVNKKKIQKEEKMICKRVKSNNCKYFVHFIVFILATQSSEVIARIPLLFPPTAPTRIQWVGGIGFPLEDLNFESMTSGWVFKAEYFLPETIKHLTIRNRVPIHAGRKLGNITKFEKFLALDEDISSTTQNATETLKYLKEKKHIRISYRWTMYKGLEGLANRMGLSGRYCVLKSICEEAENPFHFYNGLLGELLHIFLTPSTSTDELSTHSDNEYLQAEHMGRSGAKCNQVFHECPQSLLDRFSDFHNLSKDIMNIIG